MRKIASLIILLGLIVCQTKLFSQESERCSQKTERDSIRSEYIKMLTSYGINISRADFPTEVKRQLISASRKKNSVIIAGFFYRDLNGNGRYDGGEELSATLLGKPEIEGFSCKDYFNCFWFESLKPGKSYRIRYDIDGIKTHATDFRPKTGLNLFHIQVIPQKPLVYIIPHSHFDVEWAGSYEQNLKIEIPQLKQRLDLMEKNPSHCFYNDEECVTLPFTQRAGKNYTDRLICGIADKIIEPKGIVTQGELTMPYGESIIRNITSGERLLSDLTGLRIRPQVFSSIDQYGYGYQLPQILKKAGRDYFLSGEYLPSPAENHRIPHTNPEVRNDTEFWLRGLDGSKVLVYSINYSNINISEPKKLPERSHNSILNFYGTDIYPPDKRLPDRIDSLNQVKGSFKYMISSPTAYFRAAETSTGIPEFTSECFVIYWSGVYESRVEGRIMNRRIENTLLATESLATISGLKGMEFPKSTMDQAWYLIMLNQHHDPMMSPMAIPNLYEDCILPRYESAENYVTAALTGTLNWLSTEIAVNYQPGNPVIVFNPFTCQRSKVLEVRIPGRLNTPKVTDLHGNEVPCQVSGRSDLQTSVTFLAGNLPSLGWKTFFVSGDAYQRTSVSGSVKAENNLLENKFVRIELTDGQIRKIVEKSTGKTVFLAKPSAGINEIFIWKDEGCISIVQPIDRNENTFFLNNPEAVVIGRSSKVRERIVSVTEAGPVRGTIRTEFMLDCGKFIQDVSLDEGSPVIRFITNVQWNSADSITTGNGRRVRVAFSSAMEKADVCCDIPFGVIKWEQSERIRPVNSWLGMSNGAVGAAFIHHGPQSLQVTGDVAWMTLFRSVIEPPFDKNAEYHWDHPSDKATEDGDHTFSYEVYIHPGDWETANVPLMAAGENTPLYSRVSNRHIRWEKQAPWFLAEEKILPGEESFLSVKPSSLVVTAVKQTEYSDSGVVVRLYNPTPNPVKGTLTANFRHSEVVLVNFREEPVMKPETRGNDVDFTAGPFEILTFLLRTKNNFYR